MKMEVQEFNATIKNIRGAHYVDTMRAEIKRQIEEDKPVPFNKSGCGGKLNCLTWALKLLRDFLQDVYFDVSKMVQLIPSPNMAVDAFKKREIIGIEEAPKDDPSGICSTGGCVIC